MELELCFNQWARVLVRGGVEDAGAAGRFEAL